MDCFFSSLNYDRMGFPPELTELRLKMADLCLARWRQVHGVSVHVLYGEDREFQRKRRMIAENRAKTEVYVLTDDDMYPVKIDGIRELFTIYPSFAQLSVMPNNCTIVPWEGGYYDSDVMEHHSVGGVRFCRKGMQGTMPPLNGHGYDSIQAENIRSQGNKVGYAMKSAAIHLGEGLSTCWVNNYPKTILDRPDHPASTSA